MGIIQAASRSNQMNNVARRAKYLGLVFLTVIVWLVVAPGLMVSHPLAFAITNAVMATLVAPYFLYLCGLILLNMSFDQKELSGKIGLTTGWLMLEIACVIDRVLLLIPQH